MNRRLLTILLAMLLCAALFASAQASSLADIFGVEETAGTQPETSSSEEDPFADAQVAIEAPITLTESQVVPTFDLPDPEIMIGGSNDQQVPVDEIQVPTSDVDDDGVVRVLLQSLKEPELLTLTLDGIYTVENDAGFRFRRGTQIVLQNVDGRIFLSVGGLMLDMGASMKLTRQAADGRNAIYITETERDAYYPGDLEIRAEESGLRCVLTVNMEDYLRGVIAYEMGDAWPIEALKCQAVAARTYALYKKSSAGSRDYDVTDTTSDQVFKGIDPSFTNVDAAVYSTEGIIGLDEEGNAAKCWYTASNGGRIAQPEEVWLGSDPCTYIQSKDDPYDLENPKSVVKTLTFSSDVNESEKLKEMLQTALEEKYPKQDEIELDEIVSVETIDDDPRGSRMYKKLRFTVTATALVEVSAQETQTPEETAAPEVREKERRSVNEMFTVELSVYEQIKTELGLGINSGNYELCTVTEADGKFTIEMRRFGHGVGMSQRGVQCMAGTYGKTWKEIFEFYYPGLELQRVIWKTPVLEKLEDMVTLVGAARSASVAVTESVPLPDLKPGEYYAKISLGSDGSMMNLRKAPTTQSEVVTQIADGQRLIVESDTADENGWVSVHTGEYAGYAKLDYLKRE